MGAFECTILVYAVLSPSNLSSRHKENSIEDNFMGVMCQVSDVRCQVSDVKFFLLLLWTVCLTVWSVINRAYPV